MIYTSYYAKYRGENGVAVSNGCPKGLDIDRYKKLIPNWDMVQNYKSGAITWKEFRREYIKQLKHLDVDEVYEHLNGTVLLCYEGLDKKCHRHIIEEWFKRNSLECGELEATNECCTCSKCNHLLHYHRGNETGCACTKTGEIMSKLDSMIKTCEEWRYL